MDISDLFEKDLKKFKSAPFLFVGSGFSRRYINLEKWDELLKKFCIEGMQSFDYYNSKANSKLEETASLMAEDFHEIWWKDFKYSESRENYKKEGKLINKTSPLKYEISQYLSTKTLNKGTNSPDEIEHLKKIEIDGIITTNWDLLLEELFSDFEVFIGQNGLLSSVSQGIGEIYKIHGSIKDFNSLILSSEDYKDFNEKYPYLSAKLLTIFIEHPIIFIGYSISDENIKKILKAISFCLSDSAINKIKNNLFFVEPIFDNSEEKYEKTSIPIDQISIPITLIKAKNYSNIYEPLSHYKRKLSVKQLKSIKTNLYEIIRDNDPSGRIATIDIDDTTNLDNVDFVLGVGIKNEFGTNGYAGVEEIDILEDIVLNNKKYIPKQIVELSLKNVLKRNPNTPVFKYLKAGSYLDCNNNLILPVDDKIKNRITKIPIKKYYTTQTEQFIKQNRNDYKYDNNADLLLSTINFNGIKSIDLSKLELFLKTQIEFLKNNFTLPEASKIKKIIRIYDWLKYYN